MLEDEGEGVLLVLEENLEPVLGVELLTRLEPGEGWFLSGGDFAFATAKEREDIFGL
jgi:hypothetical protein